MDYIPWVRLLKAYALSIYSILAVWGYSFLESSTLNIETEEHKGEVQDYLRSQNMHTQFRGGS